MQDPISVPTSQFQPAINLQEVHHHQQQQQQQQQHDEESPAVKCPRCESTNTKFCYYNNYNLSQPRHFCKSCRRYWTKGGSLRNIPVGGGTRKNSLKRASDPSSSSAPEPKRPKTPPPPVVIVADSDKQCAAEDKLMDVNGSSFSSLLEGEGQFSNLLIDADSGEHDLNLLNWTWTDLAI